MKKFIICIAIFSFYVGAGYAEEPATSCPLENSVMIDLPDIVFAEGPNCGSAGDTEFKYEISSCINNPTSGAMQACFMYLPYEKEFKNTKGTYEYSLDCPLTD